MGTGIIVAGLVGFGIALQVAILGRSSSEANPLAVSLALLLAGIIGAATWATIWSHWPTVFETTRQWWWLPLGVGGWVLVAALGFASERIGSTTTLAVSVGVQLVAGLTIESINGERTIAVTPLVGVALILAGTIVVATSR